MRLSYLLCLISFMQVSAASIAQKITLDKSNATLKETLNDIRRQSGYSVFTDADLLINARPVNIHVKNVSLNDALKNCFINQPFNYVIDDKTILVTPKVNNKALPAAINITGKVFDENNRSVPGVTIKIKNTQTGVVTNEDGSYKIAVPENNAVLVFSFIGYISQEVPVLGKTVINVTLKAQNTGLNEVVVVGYGSQKKKDLTGSVGSIKISDFEKAPVKSFDEALAGRIAGVQVAGNDGQPGSLNNITIRGSNSITQDNSPLYVIDGFPVENYDNNTINPADIAAIDVLKDASATAIYGARGANGVIIITTKRGSKEAPVVNLNGYYGLQQDPKILKVMDAYEFVRYQLELVPDATPTGAAAIYLANGRTLDYYKNVAPVDFQRQIIRVAPIQNYDLSIRGGNQQTQYSISGNIFNQSGILINSGFKRYQGRITLDQRVNSKLKVGVTANYSNSKSYGANVSAATGTASAFYAAWGFRPTTGNSGTDLTDLLYDPSIDYNVVADYRVNPRIDLENIINQTVNNSFMANGYGEYLITPNLTLRVTGGITANTVVASQFYNSQTQAGNARNAALVNGSIYNSPSQTWLNENTLTYNKVINRDHNLNILAGFTSQGSNYGTNGLYAAQVANESLGLNGLAGAPTQIITSTSSNWNLASFLGRVNYNYRSKYLVTASFRADGSSRFSPGNQWGYFPSGSVAWRMSEENFMKGITAVSDSKLRFSYGATGNNRVSDFATYSQLAFTANYSYNNGVPSQGTSISAIGNTTLKWETTTQADLGYDLSLLKNRIGLTVDLYSKITSNLLLNASLPYTTGLSNGYKNVGKVENKGLEITINTVNYSGKNFTWNSNFNISFNSNKVLGLTQNQNSLTSLATFNVQYNTFPAYITSVGQPIGQMYGLVWDGVYQYNDFNKLPDGRYVLKANVPTNGNVRSVIQPGDIKYKDLNGDGVVNALDNTVIGRGLPIHTGGFSNNFTYKGFDLNILFQWSYGNDILNANRYIFEGNAVKTPALNQYANYADRWEPDNPSNTLFRAGGQGPYAYSSRVIEDGSFLRLKTVSLGFNFSKPLLNKMNIKNLRVYASGQNLYTWTKYSGVDPEVSIRNSALTPGLDYSAYPRARTIIFGANVSF